MIRSLRRKFSISAPRLSVRPHVPWYVRWAIVLPILALFGLLVWWAYNSGLEFAGFHRGQTEKELTELRERVHYLESENASQANQIAAYERQGQIEQASTQGIEAQLRSLNDENARLKEDLLFFQNLPLTGAREAELSIHRLKIEPDSLPGEYLCRMLLVQSVQQRGKAFQGNMQLVVNGEQDGRKVVLQFPQEDSPSDVAGYQLSFKYYQRVDKGFKLPPEMKVESVQVRVFEKGMQEPKVQQTVNLPS
ncbi:keratin [Sideroxyarcus emersonii]|nr:keratin [Sideroxyarcus emersonii]